MRTLYPICVKKAIPALFSVKRNKKSWIQLYPARNLGKGGLCETQVMCAV